MGEVAIIQELMPGYRVPFFEELKRSLASDDIRLRVIHGRAHGDRAAHGDEASLDWAEQVTNRLVPVLPGAAPAVWQAARGSVGNADLVVLEHANRLLLNHVLLASQRTHPRRRIAFWGHGANLQASSPHGPAERLKRWTARRPSWWFAYTEGSARRVEAAGFPAERITVVQNSVDVSPYRAAKTKSPLACVFLGSLHAHKRVDFMLDSIAALSQTLPDFTVSIVGDGPLRDRVARAAELNSRIQYMGPLSGRDKAEVVAAASVMLMPGLVGLAIVESFAAECPMVTLHSSAHSPEYEYAVNGENALILHEQATPRDFADAVANLLLNRTRLAQLQEGCRAAAERYSLEAMVENFSQGIRSALDCTL